MNVLPSVHSQEMSKITFLSSSVKPRCSVGMKSTLLISTSSSTMLRNQISISLLASLQNILLNMKSHSRFAYAFSWHSVFFSSFVSSMRIKFKVTPAKFGSQNIRVFKIKKNNNLRILKFLHFVPIRGVSPHFSFFLKSYSLKTVASIPARHFTSFGCLH